MTDLADRVGAAVLAPLFPAGIDDPNDLQNYKMLLYQGIRYDSILLSITDEVAAQAWHRHGEVFLDGIFGWRPVCVEVFLFTSHLALARRDSSRNSTIP
jgi:hypothetical protein